MGLSDTEKASIKAETAQVVRLESLIDHEKDVVRKVRLSYVDDNKGRGMVATQALAKDEVFLSVPAHLLYCCPQDPQDATRALSNVHRLVCKLLTDRATHDDTLTSEWLGMLPTDFNSIVTWEDNAIALLGTTMRKSMAKKLKSDLTSEYKSVCNDLDANFSYEDFCWGHCVVHTRGFSFRGGDWTLIPYADMFNHHPDGCDRFEYVEDEGAFVFTADRAYAEGDEVLLKYNKVGGWEQLANYGFLDTDARNATFPICLLPPELTLPPTDLDTLQQRSLDEHRLSLGLTRKGPTKDAMKAMRLRFLSTADSGGDAMRCSFASKVSLENEWNCWVAMCAYCRNALEMFDFTEAEDTAQLEDETLSRNCKLAVQLRATDRSMLKESALQAHRMQLVIAKQMVLIAEDTPYNGGTDAEAALRLSREVSVLRAIQ